MKKTHRKITALAAAIALTAACPIPCTYKGMVTPITASAASLKTDNGIYYEESWDGEYLIITNYRGSDEELVIPSEIDGKPVGVIGEGAFTNKSSLIKVTVPEGIEVEIDAFKGCRNLEEINIGKDCSICSGAFENCPSLTAVNIEGDTIEVSVSAFLNTPWFEGAPDGVVYIGTTAWLLKGGIPENGEITIKDGTTCISNNLFIQETNLVSIVLPDSLERIEDYAFAHCSNLKSVELPEGLKYIGNYAFVCNTSLESIEVPDTVEKMGAGAFYGCSNLKSAKLSPKITDLTFSFSDCTSLEEIEIPEDCDNVTMAFSNCTSLKKAVLPDTLKTISFDAFKGCTSLEDINMPAELEKIESTAFKDCASLKKISLPDSVNKIEPMAFKNCTSLEEVEFPSSAEIGSNVFEGTKWLEEQPAGPLYVGDALYCCCGELPENSVITVKDGTTKICVGAFTAQSGLKGIELPDSVSEICDGAFEKCTSLESITLPDKVTTLEADVFKGCKSLKEINCGKDLRRVISGSLDDTAWLENHPHGVVSLGTTVYTYKTDENKKGEIDLYIEDGTEYINAEAFAYICGDPEYCESIRTLSLPSSLKEIDSHAVLPSEYFTDLYFRGTEEQFNNIADDGDCFGYISDTTAIHFLGETPQGQAGDIDGNGTINPVDATAILRHYTASASGGTSEFTDEQKQLADVNKDGKVNPVDATTVLNYYTYSASGGTLGFEEYMTSGK